MEKTVTITKEYVEGGVNTITTTVETVFTATDVLQSRADLLDNSIDDIQTKKEELLSDIQQAQAIPASEDNNQ